MPLQSPCRRGSEPGLGRPWPGNTWCSAAGGLSILASDPTMQAAFIHIRPRPRFWRCLFWAIWGPPGGLGCPLGTADGFQTGFQNGNTLSCPYTTTVHPISVHVWHRGVLCNMLRQQCSVSAQYLHQCEPSIASAPSCAVRQMAAAHQPRRGHNHTVCSSPPSPSPRPRLRSLHSAFACNRRRHLLISSESEA